MSFIPPPTSLSVELQLDFHAANNATHPFIVYPMENGDLRTYTFADVVPKIHQVADFVQHQLSSHSPSTIAFIATSDSLTSFMIIMGILRAGMSAFPVSPRFSPEVLSKLMMEVRPTYVMSEDKFMLMEVLNTIPDGERPTVLDLPSRAMIFSSNQAIPPLPEHGRTLSSPQYVIHSSDAHSLLGTLAL
ncbi:hypothetical protein F5050DRAFT_1810303 [Lentinula boryana]|uniref:AMP-dependent synthetase/ligase domain-containing protein n=1 Tax=Lentinula boryana TaxID=40481 RepID=A0ABQ8Q5A0_9AGAR|nr:hypothetical protein F5050DRAFT_1810303 [Lentinula boryana]